MRLLLLLSLCALLAAAPTATVASQCHGDVTIGKAADAELWRHCTHISGNLRIIVRQINDEAETEEQRRR